MNPLHDLVRILPSDRYMTIAEICIPISYHLKMAGVNIKSSKDIIACILTLVDLDFLEVKKDNIRLLRLNPAVAPM